MKSLVKIVLFLSPYKQPVVVKEKEISIFITTGMAFIKTDDF